MWSRVVGSARVSAYPYSPVRTRVRLTWNLLRGTIALKADWFDFATPVTNPVTVWIDCGPHEGSREVDLWERKPGKFVD